MTTINDRIGSQNVIRVLSNASAPPTRLANLSDVNSTRKTEDGLVLVWDLPSEQFILTDVIDAANLILTGITSFSNVTNSTNPLEGAVKISGGVGIAKNLNIGEQLQVTGVSTFVGVVTTTNDLYVGGDLYVKDDIILDEVSARQINISGIGSFGSIYIGGTEVISSTRELKNIVSLDAVTTSTIETAIANAPNTFTDLNITGIATFLDQTNINHLSVTGVTTVSNDVVFTGATSNARWDYSTSDLILFDNTRLEFGNNKDFEIWHGGAHTYLKNSGGDLRIRANLLKLQKEDGTETYVQATSNQDVKLFFNGIEKMATTLDGVNVLGTLTAQLIDGGSY